MHIKEIGVNAGKWVDRGPLQSLQRSARIEVALLSEFHKPHREVWITFVCRWRPEAKICYMSGRGIEVSYSRIPISLRSILILSSYLYIIQFITRNKE